MSLQLKWLTTWSLGAILALSCVACGAGQSGQMQSAPALPTLTPAPTPVPQALFVDAGQSLGPISPLVYGASYGPWISVPYDLLPQAQASGITYLRFPGGEWGDQHDLKDYQIDQFITLARHINAEPKINVRMPGGSPQAAADLVRYSNIKNDYNVRYWSIGNEPSLYTSYTMYDDYDTARYNKEWRAFAKAMRAVDPTIKLVGPETHQYKGDPDFDPRDEAGRDWLREFLQANGDIVDVVSIHRYPFPTGMSAPPLTTDNLRANSREWDTIIPNLRALIRETTGRDIPVAVSEINSDWSHATGGEATPDSFYNALWWGDVLGRLIRQKVDIVAYFLLQSKTSQGGWGLLNKFDVRPTYYVYQMYHQFGNELVYASSDDPDLSIFAARRQDGPLTILLINLGPKEICKPLQLENFTPTDSAEMWLFDKEHPAEPIGVQTIDNSPDIVVPPQSILLYVLQQENLGR